MTVETKTKNKPPDEDWMMRRRNAQNRVPTFDPLSAAAQLARLQAVAQRAREQKAVERVTDMDRDALVRVFESITSVRALALAARVCSIWREAAVHLRRDLVWQLSNLAVVNGVPEALLIPHSAERLRQWVAERPQEAVCLLSIKQLRAAGAAESLVAQRLDCDDGILFKAAMQCASLEVAAMAISAAREAVVAELQEEAEEAQSPLPGGRRRAWSRTPPDESLPLKCRLERDEASEDAVRIIVRGRLVGFVPQSFVATVAVGEARVVSVYDSGHSPALNGRGWSEPGWSEPGTTWKVRALPAADEPRSAQAAASAEPGAAPAAASVATPPSPPAASAQAAGAAATSAAAAGVAS